MPVIPLSGRNRVDTETEWADYIKSEILYSRWRRRCKSAP